MKSPYSPHPKREKFDVTDAAAAPSATFRAPGDGAELRGHGTGRSAARRAGDDRRDQHPRGADFGAAVRVAGEHVADGVFAVDPSAASERPGGRADTDRGGHASSRGLHWGTRNEVR